MRTNDSVADKIVQLKRELAELKATQPIGGDGWLMYRTELSIWVGNGSVRTATLTAEFVPDNPGIFPVIFTLAPGDVPTWNTELLQESPGVYKYTANEQNMDFVNGYIRLIAQSTRKGTITGAVTNLTFW